MAGYDDHQTEAEYLAAQAMPAAQDPHRAWLAAWVLVCALGAAFCIGLAIWLDANLPAITECRL